MMKGLIHQEYKAILNVYIPNNITAKFVKQKRQLKGEINHLYDRETSTLFSQQLIENQQGIYRTTQQQYQPTGSH